MLGMQQGFGTIMPAQMHPTSKFELYGKFRYSKT